MPQNSNSLPEQLEGTHILPVRHHSPAAAMAVERALLALRPRIVLIEGPSDATDLIPLLLQPDTRPPVAILAYRPAAGNGEPRTMVDPFCDYSPELVAMRVASGMGAAIRFIDAPAGAFFDIGNEKDEVKPEEETLPDTPSRELFQDLAHRFGFSTHDEFWDSRIEMADPETVVELIGSYGDMVRDWFGEKGMDRELDRARESWMLAQIGRAIDEGYGPKEIAVVCGAAHSAGLRTGSIDERELSRIRQSQPARFALIPYSYPRLSEQSGYGAGNRAPAFYQELWRRQGDWNGVALDFLLRLMNRMRGRGFTLSLADAIEAERLATNLAGLRDKPSIGLEEVRQAATACYGRGSEEPRRHLDELLVGEEVGSVSSLAAKTALQQEFQDQVKRHGIPFSDSPRDFRLNLTGPGERAASAFLHRLVVAGVPFARLSATGSTARSPQKEEGEDSLERLRVLREKWNVRWTPSTDIRLIELAIYGNGLAEVCHRLLRRRLEGASKLAEASSVLLDAVMGRLDTLYDEVLAACERASGEDDDFHSLSRACYLLDGLVDYGGIAGRRELLSGLGERVFARACLLLPGAAGVADDEVSRVSEGLKLIHQVGIRRRQRGESIEILIERLRRSTAEDGEIHPAVAGLASALLYLDGHLSDQELSDGLGLRLSRGEEPLRAAQFVEGLFSLNRSVLVRNRAIVGNLSGFLSQLDREQFLAVLPVLRRSLAGLNSHEMGYLVGTIAAVLGITAEKTVKAVANPDQLDELAALDQEIGDLFG